jgi:hypothetical protein
MKKIITWLFIGIASMGMAHAKGLHGAYAGAAVGLSLAKVNYKMNDGEIVFKKGDGHMEGPNGLFFVGYGHHFPNCFYLGIELQLDVDSSKAKTIFKDDQVKATAERNGAGYAVVGRIGYAIIPMKSMFYVGLGGKSIDWEYKVTDSAGLSKTASNRSFRFYGEAGAEGAFNHMERLGWRLSYSVTPGKQVSGSPFPADHALATAPGNGMKFKSTEHLIRFGVFYRH